MSQTTIQEVRALSLLEANSQKPTHPLKGVYNSTYIDIKTLKRLIKLDS
jgi:hypothetical protein